MCRACHRWQGRMLCTTCLTPDIMAQARCRRCALVLTPHPTHGEEGLCQLCAEEPPAFDHAVAALDYVAPWRQLIAALKFRKDPAIAQALGGLLLEQILKSWGLRTPGQSRTLLRLRAGAPTLILPVPLSASRLCERGYNQAALLGRHIAETLELPMRTDILTRPRDTARLMSLDADERQRHISGAFNVPPELAALIRGRHVAVVDDVLTTGATLNEIARTLWSAGAREVSVWVVARTPAPAQRASESSLWQATQPSDKAA
jgi:ComF family protein